jgi:hypothetical protein
MVGVAGWSIGGLDDMQSLECGIRSDEWRVLHAYPILL